MATPTIPNGEEYFFPLIYEGNSAGQRVGKFVPFTDSGTIANSVIYNRADTPKLAKTPSSDGNRKTFTISVWYKPTDLGTDRTIISADTSASGTNYAMFKLDSNNKLFFYSGTAGGGDVISTRTFEDSSKFYHFMVVVDTTQSTASDRVKFYVDGNLITSLDSASYPSQDGDTNFNSTSYPMAVGSFNSLTSICAGGNLAEFNFVDGTALTPSTFGLTNTSTGRWIPKTLTGITYGTNGFRLTFADSSALGDDLSGNTNDFTATNLASTDQTTDSPTQLFNTMGSFSSGVTKAEGNLKITTPSSGSGFEQCVGQPAFGVRSGKWYWEVKVNVKGQNGYGWKSDDNTGGSQANATGNYKQGAVYVVGGVGGFVDGTWDVNLSTGASEFSAFTTASVDDVIMFAIDLDNRKGYVGLNGTWFNSANPTNGTGSIGLGRDPVPSANAKFYPMCMRINTTATGTYNFGGTSFAHTPPTGFVALGQDNLPEATKGISGLVWTKNRDTSDSHQLYDSSRGKHKNLQSDATNAESTTIDGLQKFLAGGQQIEDDVSINTAGESYVSWNWVGNSGSTSSNSNGSVTSTVQANQTAGFSIVQYTGTGSAATVGHGLSSTPKWIFGRPVEQTGGYNWSVYHKSMTSASYYLELNTSDAEASNSNVWGSAPTSSVVNIGSGMSASSEPYILYCWHSVDGFSKFGSYSGNGSTDGPFIYTGFRPAWLLIKRTDSSTGGNWSIIDNTRYPSNPIGAPLLADSTDAESGLSSITMDLLSNGFKIRNTLNSNNNSSGSYIYMAFAEHPFVGDGTNPVTAR
ncbi:hypothetical protein [uncultured Mediterranean phage uvMED]|nr:hypothetical protein [uncultured Mediterranean phage uvMED]